MYTDKTILLNAIITPDGTYLESTHRHDYKSYVDSVSGETYMVDGGRDYIRGSINKVKAKQLHTYVEDPIEIIRERIKWGRNYNEDMERLPETEYIYIKDLTEDHIENILKGDWAHGHMVDVFMRELCYRREMK